MIIYDLSKKRNLLVILVCFVAAFLFFYYVLKQGTILSVTASLLFMTLYCICDKIQRAIHKKPYAFSAKSLRFKWLLNLAFMDIIVGCYVYMDTQGNVLKTAVSVMAYTIVDALLMLWYKKRTEDCQ